MNPVQEERALQSNNAPISSICSGSGDGVAVDPCPDDGQHLDSASNVLQSPPEDDAEIVGSGDGVEEVLGFSELDEPMRISSLPSATPEPAAALSSLLPSVSPSAGLPQDFGSVSGLESAAEVVSSGSDCVVGKVFGPSQLDEPISVLSLPSGTPEPTSALSSLSIPPSTGPPEHSGSVSGLESDLEVVSSGSGEGVEEVFGPSKLDELIPASSLSSGTPKPATVLSSLSTSISPSAGPPERFGSKSGLESAPEEVSLGSGEGVGGVFSFDELDKRILDSTFPSRTLEPASALSLLSTYASPSPGPHERFGLVSGLNGDEAVNPSELEGAEDWKVMGTISSTGDEAINPTSSDSSSSYEPLGFNGTQPAFDPCHTGK